MEFTFSGFDSTDFALNDTAMITDTDILQLTTESEYQSGSAWYEELIPITENTDLDFYTVFQIPASESGGADGLTVSFQGSPAGKDALGLDGGRLGYQGINNSLAIELDTYKNEWDLDNNHGALIVNGDLEDPLLNGGNLPFELDGGENVHLWFEYSASNDLLEVFINNVDEKPDDPYLVATEIQIEDYLGSEAYFGFTAATGAKFSEHSVLEENLLVNNPPEAPLDNNPPEAPLIINPPTGSIINPASLKFQLPEDFTLNDPDGDRHGHTDYEIWLEGENQPAWVAYDVTDEFFKIHGVFPTIGTFVNSHSERNSLLPDENYILRVRVADELGAESPWTEQINRTSSVVEPSPEENIPWEVLEEGYAIDVVAEGLRLPVQLDFNTTNGLIVGSELHDGPFTMDSSGNVYRLATLIDYDPGNDIGGQSERGAIGIVYDEESHSIFQGLLDADDHPVIYRLFLSDDGLSATSIEKVWEYPDEGRQAHQIGNLAIHDGYLFVNMGDKFDPQTAENLDSPWGKILRMNLDGSAVTNNPFYDASDGINAKDYIYSYGYRNPIGGDWFDGQFYIVENGPNSNDRLALTLPGQNYGWNGEADSLVPDSLYVWEETESPVDITFDDDGNGYISQSGPTYGSGPSKGKTIDKVTFTEDGTTVASPPTDFVRYTGDGKETASGVLYIPEGFDFSEGVYWTSLYPDNPDLGPTGVGARLYRVSEVT